MSLIWSRRQIKLLRHLLSAPCRADIRITSEFDSELRIYTQFYTQGSTVECNSSGFTLNDEDDRKNRIFKFLEPVQFSGFFCRLFYEFLNFMQVHWGRIDGRRG